MKSLTKYLLLLIALFALINSVNAQVGIGTNSPNSNVILDIKSVNKGVLLPRTDANCDMTLYDGSLVYDSISHKFKYCNVSTWLTVNPLNTDVNDNVTAPKSLVVTENFTVNGTAVSIPNANTVNAANATLTANNFVGYGTIPIGGIIMWSGNVNSLPQNWKLCDGGTYSSVVTPNLQGKFILGYDQNNPSAPKTGGSDQITLNADQMPRHTHNQGTLVNAVAGLHQHDYYGYRAVDNGGGEHVKSRGNISTDPKDYGGAPAGNHTHAITGLTGLEGGKIVRYDQDLSGSPTHYFIYEPGCSDEYEIWEWIDEASGKGHWMPNPNYYLNNPACINPVYNPNYGNWNIPVWEVQPFDNRPAYYVLAFIMRVQ